LLKRQSDLARAVLVLCSAALLFVSHASYAGPSEGGSGTHLAPFLEIEPGARQVGMGGAFVGVADDAVAIFWNPAGLRFVEASQISLNQASWPSDMSYQFMCYAFRHDFFPGVLGLSWSVLQMDRMAVIQEFGQPSAENFDAGQMAFGFSWAGTISNAFSFGATVRWYHLGVWNEKSEGLCGDVGLLYELGWKDARVGVSVQNLGPENSYIDEKFSLPWVLRGGGSFELVKFGKQTLLAAGDMVVSADRRTTTSVGAEYSYMDTFFLRGGYKLNYDSYRYAVGAGSKFNTSRTSKARIDYAYSDMHYLGASHRISVTFIF